MIPRKSANDILELATQYRVLTLLGPRQSGKTTLAKFLFPDKKYINFENPETRALALADPNHFFKSVPAEGVILDEIQRVPELLSYIQIMADEQPQKGRFILTGSHQLQLHRAISQSLAGRTSLSKLFPLTISELPNRDSNPFSVIQKGFYPAIFNDNLKSHRFYEFYFQTYVERDLREMIHIKDLHLFHKFLKLLAGRAGALLNFSGLASDCGISDKTVKEWISILEASYLIFLLQPYHSNFGKRAMKSPKLYFVDTGFLCYLLEIFSPKTLERDPLRGNLFENFIVADIYKELSHTGNPTQLYFYRDSHGNEIDLLFKVGTCYKAVEIKSAETYHNELTRGLRYFKSLIEDANLQSYLIYNGTDAGDAEQMRILNWCSLNEIYKG